MEPETCPIWETDCKLASRDWEFWLDVDSPRAGGKYSVIRAVAASISNLTPRQKAILTSWLIDQRRAGIENPKVTADTIEEIRSRSSIL
jgi:hypothetical protein